jgi:hypothetical protein
LKTKDFFRGNLCNLGFFDSLNPPVHVTAARLRILPNVKGLVCAATRDGERYLILSKNPRRRADDLSAPVQGRESS